MALMYDDLAAWWPLLSPVEDYADEAAFFLSLLAEVTARPGAALLELGSGGGSNAFHVKRVFGSVTLVDLSPAMLDVSRALNPDCEHVQGDMRDVRLGRAFDAVFIHDAIDYMVTTDDLRRALATAFVHLAPGGMALFVPDHVRETFEPSTDHGGADGDGRALRYLEWTRAHPADDSRYVTDYVYVLGEGDGPPRVEHERHEGGLFPLADWLRLLAEVGFRAEPVVDGYGRHVFVARKA